MTGHEFSCNACGQSFSKVLAPDEYLEGGTVRPFCNSEDVEHLLTAFYPIERRETA